MRTRPLLFAVLTGALATACGELETTTALAVAADADVGGPALSAPEAGADHFVSVDRTGAASLVVGRGDDVKRFTVHTRRVQSLPFDDEDVAPASGLNDDVFLDRGIAIERLVSVEEGLWQSWLFFESPGDDDDIVVRVHIPEAAYVTSVGAAHWFRSDDQVFQYGLPTWIDADGHVTAVQSTWDAAAGDVVIRVPQAIVASSSFPAELDPLIGPELDVDSPVQGPNGFEETTPAVASNTSGSTWLAVWRDTRNDAGGDIYGTRLASDGTVLDTLSLPIATGAGFQTEPRVAPAASGGWLVVWTEAGDIRGALVSATGAAGTSFSIAGSTGDQDSPDVASDGTNTLVAWRAGSDIRAAGVSTTGTVTAVGALTSSAANERRPSVALDSTPSGNFFVVFEDAAVPDDTKLRGVRVTRAGAVLDVTPRPVALAPGNHLFPRVAWAGSFVVTYTRQLGTYHIGATRISTGGVDLDVTDVVVAPSLERQVRQSIACAADNSCLILFNSGSTKLDVLGVSLSSGFAPGGVTTVSSHSRTSDLPAIARGASSYLGVWEDLRRGAVRDIIGSRLSAGGGALDPSGIIVSRGWDRDHNSRVGSSSDGFLAVWSDGGGTAGATLRGRRFELNGVPTQGVGLYIGGNINNSVALNNTLGIVLAGGTIDATVTACGSLISAGPNNATNAGAICGANTPFNPIGNGAVPAPQNPPDGWTGEDAFFYDWSSPCNYYSKAAGTNAGFFYWDPTANSGTCGAYVGPLVPPSTTPTTTGGCWVPIFVGATPTVYAPYGTAAPQEVTTLSSPSPAGCRSWEPQSATGTITDGTTGGSGTATNWYTGGAVTRAKPNWALCGGPTFPASRVQWGTTPPNPQPVGPDETCAGDCTGATKVLDYCPALGTSHLDFNYEVVAARKAAPAGVFYVDGAFTHNDGNTYDCNPDDQTNPAPNGTVWPMTTLIVNGDYTQPSSQVKSCFGVGTKKGTYASLVVDGNIIVGSAQSVTRTAGSLLVRGTANTKGMTVFGTMRVDGGFGQQSSASFTWRYTRDIAANGGGGTGSGGIDGPFTLGGGASGSGGYPSISQRTLGSDYLVAWEDTRADIGDIYASRVSTAGVVRDPSGIPVSTAGSMQVAPAVAAGASNFLAVWQHRLGDLFDIHGALVTAAGAVSVSDIVISSAAADQLVPTVAYDATTNTYLVAWQDTRDAGDRNIYASRVSSTGVVLDPNGVVISNATGLQEHPVASAAGGIVVVAWADQRSTTRDIYAGRIKLVGAITRLDGNGRVICSAADAQTNPAIDTDGQSFGILWNDYRSGNSDIFGAALLSDGTVLPPDGVALTALGHEETEPSVAARLGAVSGQPFRGIFLYTRRRADLETERVQARAVSF